MSRTLTVVTPENVEVTFELAGLGTRFLAAMVDYFLVGLTITVVLGVFLSAGAGFFKLTGTWLIGICIFLAFATDWCYFIGFESSWRGQTPGKRHLKLRVLREGGFPLDSRAVLVRNFMRPVDFLPSLYSVGVIAIFASSSNQRLGDMAAGTVVVRERVDPEKIVRVVRMAPGRFSPEVLERLSGEELSLLRSYVSRRDDLDAEVGERISTGLSRLLSQRLGLLAEVLLPADMALLDLWSDWDAWHHGSAELPAPHGLGAPGEWRP